MWSINERLAKREGLDLPPPNADPIVEDFMLLNVIDAHNLEKKKRKDPKAGGPFSWEEEDEFLHG